jgi:hypothetical protein
LIIVLARSRLDKPKEQEIVWMRAGSGMPLAASDSYVFGKPPSFCSFASSVERSCAGAFASFARSFCRFSFR